MAALRLLDRFLDVCGRLFQALANTCLALMLVMNIAQIFTRGVFDVGIPWVFPWTMFLFVWMVFFGFFVIQRMGTDITVDFFVDRFGKTGHFVSRVFVDLLTIGLMLVLIIHLPQWLRQQIGDTIEMVHFDRWVQNIPLLVSCILIMLNVVSDLMHAFLGDPEPEHHPTGDI